MMATILTLNVGSSSVKFRLFAEQDGLPLMAGGKISGIGTAPVFETAGISAGEKESRTLPAQVTQEDALGVVFSWIGNHTGSWTINAVAHRVVHGGTAFTGPVRVTPDILDSLKKLCPLAPMHQAHNCAALEIASKLLPQAPQIACFDTAFHARHDPLFSHYAVPDSLTAKGIRRYGFHGLSYEWIAHVLRKKHPALAKGRVIAAHLGNGASLCAMVNGLSVDTTMGMTALEGLPMGTRCGSLDPGAVLYMIRDLGLTPEETEHILYEQSGLKGLSGATNDVKILLESRDPKAKFALDYYALKTAQFIAMMAVSMGGIDGIVFTGGIGENAAPVRDAVLRRLSFLGSFQVLVIAANEERAMAMQAQRLLEAKGA